MRFAFFLFLPFSVATFVSPLDLKAYNSRLKSSRRAILPSPVLGCVQAESMSLDIDRVFVHNPHLDGFDDIRSRGFFVGSSSAKSAAACEQPTLGTSGPMEGSQAAAGEGSIAEPERVETERQMSADALKRMEIELEWIERIQALNSQFRDRKSKRELLSFVEALRECIGNISRPAFILEAVLKHLDNNLIVPFLAAMYRGRFEILTDQTHFSLPAPHGLVEVGSVISFSRVWRRLSECVAQNMHLESCVSITLRFHLNRDLFRGWMFGSLLFVEFIAEGVRLSEIFEPLKSVRGLKGIAFKISDVIVKRSLPKVTQAFGYGAAYVASIERPQLQLGGGFRSMHGRAYYRITFGEKIQGKFFCSLLGRHLRELSDPGQAPMWLLFQFGEGTLPFE